MTWVETRALFGWTMSLLRGSFRFGRDGSTGTERMTANGASFPFPLVPAEVG
jgi:hypothetical protein